MTIGLTKYSLCRPIRWWEKLTSLFDVFKPRLLHFFLFDPLTAREPSQYIAYYIYIFLYTYFFGRKGCLTAIIMDSWLKY
jgi:hypothetical protein